MGGGICKLWKGSSPRTKSASTFILDLLASTPMRKWGLLFRFPACSICYNSRAMTCTLPLLCLSTCQSLLPCSASSCCWRWAVRAESEAKHSVVHQIPSPTCLLFLGVHGVVECPVTAPTMLVYIEQNTLKEFSIFIALIAPSLFLSLALSSQAFSSPFWGNHCQGCPWSPRRIGTQ